MKKIVEDVSSGNFIDAQKSISEALYRKAAVVIEAKKMQVTAEVYPSGKEEPVSSDEDPTNKDKADKRKSLKKKLLEKEKK